MGDVGGMVSLGAMALKGLGMPVNTTEALRLFQKVHAFLSSPAASADPPGRRRCLSATRAATTAWDTCICTVLLLPPLSVGLRA